MFVQNGFCREHFNDRYRVGSDLSSKLATRQVMVRMGLVATTTAEMRMLKRMRMLKLLMRMLKRMC